MTERVSLRRGLAVIAVLWPTAALAHPVGGIGSGLAGGLLHPFSGWDHVLVMLAVGLWSVRLGRPAIWVLPVTFLIAMAFGGTLAFVGITLPGREIGIAASAIGLGLAVLAAVRLPLPAAAALVGCFAIFHGHAHGTELPAGASGLLYSVGFVIATGCLHAGGIGIGLAHRWRPDHVPLRAAGAFVAAAGVVILWHAIR